MQKIQVEGTQPKKGASMRNKWLTISVTLGLILWLALVAGLKGPAGPQGSPGDQGPPGPASEAAEYVGFETCSICHSEIYEVFARSGQLWKLTRVVDNRPPNYAFTEPCNPPEGYAWDDISYVMGGYEGQVRFLDRNGYIITRDSDANF
jgi:hypothetical protein